MGICSAIIGLFVLVFVIRTKLKPMDVVSVIRLKQKLIVSVCSALLWGFFSIWLATILWSCLFFACRCVFFRIDALRIEELYRKHDGGQNYPKIYHVREYKAAYFLPARKKTTEVQFRYPFSDHMLSMLVLVLLVYFGVATVSRDSMVVYYIEFLTVATAGYVFIGKFIYHISLNSPTSIFYLSPTLAYIPVILVGILYYFVCVVVILTTSTGMKI